MHNRLKTLRFIKTPLYWHDCCRDIHQRAGRFKPVREDRNSSNGSESTREWGWPKTSGPFKITRRS